MLNVSTLDDVSTRVQLASDVIQNNEFQIARTVQAMHGNDHDEADLVPDAPDPSAGITYGRQIEKLRSGIKRVRDANDDIAEELAAEAFRRRTQAKRRLAIERAKEDESLDKAEHEIEKAERAKPVPVEASHTEEP